MSIEQNKECVLSYMRLFEQGDIEGAMALVAEDAVFWHPMSGETSKAQTRATFEGMGAQFKSFSNQIRSVTAEQDRVSMEIEATAVMASGKRYFNRYHFLFVLRAGKIVASREYVDTMPVREAFS